MSLRDREPYFLRRINDDQQEHPFEVYAGSDNKYSKFVLQQLPEIQRRLRELEFVPKTKGGRPRSRREMTDIREQRSRDPHIRDLRRAARALSGEVDEPIHFVESGDKVVGFTLGNSSR